jgi:murein DD-endopeptidase MepM/ murein hydrolase activator NlpD
VPSHGTDALGQRYAYDFVGVDPASASLRYHKHSSLRYLVAGVPLQDYFGWGQPVYAPLEGTVVQALDGWPERNPVHLVRDLALALKHGFTFDVKGAVDFRPLAGNYILLETTAGYALFAHAQTGSVAVAPGDRVAPGQLLARVGHSGNSTAPHLHFHLMDGPDPRKAQGIPCCFRAYEALRAGTWQPVQNGLPNDKERIRRL